jgi:hypothetical protein
MGNLETCRDWKTWNIELTTDTVQITTDVNYIYMGLYNNDSDTTVFMRETNTNIITAGMPIGPGGYKSIPVFQSGNKYIKAETATVSMRIEIGLGLL